MKYTRKGRWAQNPLSVSGRVGKWTGVKKNQLDPHSCVSGLEWGECIVENGWRLSLYPPFYLHRLAQCLGGKLEPFCRLCGNSRGYRRDLAIGRYSCQSCHYLWTQEHACTHTVCAHTDKNTHEHTQAIACLAPTDTYAVHIHKQMKTCTHRHANSI